MRRGRYARKLTHEEAEFKRIVGYRIMVAFRRLRRNSYYARRSFQCCSGCAWSIVPEGREDKVIFYHRQETERLTDGKPFHLAWAGDAKEIADALTHSGLRFEHDGSPDQTFKITGFVPLRVYLS